MVRPLLPALLFALAPALLSGCYSESTQCNGVVVAGTCQPCPGTMVGNECVLPEDIADEPEPECTNDQRCLPVGVCLGGKCGTECTRSSDCPTGALCLLYRCVWEDGDVVEDTTGLISCVKHIDCDAFEMACIDGFCNRECTKDWHCEGEDAACVGYMCQSGTTKDDAVADTGEPEDVLPPNCTPSPGQYGDACDCKQECANELCLENKVTKQAQCTQYCATDAQCLGTDVCVPVAPDVSVCIVNDSGQATSCDPDQAICYKALFLTNKRNECACTTPCKKATDCPEGFGCHVLGADKVCVSTGEVCGDGFNPCFGECAGNPDTGVGFCTSICLNTTDCPSGWTCQSIGGGVSVCASPQ